MNKLSQVLKEACGQLADESLSSVLCSCLPSFPSEADWGLKDFAQFVRFCSVELKRYRSNTQQTEQTVERRMESELTRQKGDFWKCISGCPARWEDVFRVKLAVTATQVPRLRHQVQLGVREPLAPAAPRVPKARVPGLQRLAEARGAKAISVALPRSRPMANRTDTPPNRSWWTRALLGELPGLACKADVKIHENSGLQA